jgi:ribosomal-protein-alanine N-acetyltransferase
VAAVNATRQRSLGVDDLDVLHALEMRAQPLPWSDDQLLLELVNDDAKVNGVFIDTELVGYVALRKMVDELWVLNIAVDPAHRCHGHGRALLESALQHGRALGLASLWLEVRQGNAGARKLYGAMGLEETATRSAYYPPLPPATAREAAVVMSRTL